MTEAEISILTNAVIKRLRANAKEVAQLVTAQSVNDDDLVELNGGRNVSLGTLLRYLIQNNVSNLITTSDSTIPNDVQAFSSLRTIAEIALAVEQLQDKYIHKDRNDRTNFLVDFYAGLSAGMYHEGGTGGSKLFKNGKAELGKLQVNGDSEFRKNLSSKDFISGFTAGKGWAIMLKEYLNAAGVKETKSYAEFDNLTIRGTLRVFEFIVSQMLGENDNRTFTAMMEVDHYDPKTGKVYLDTQDGKLYNPFRKDDIIVVQQYQPGNTGAEGGNGYIVKSYELVITDVGVGNLSDKEERLDWVTFKNFVTTMEGVYPKDLISQHDTFVRIDNLSDPTRKGIIQMMTVGENTPYMDIIYGAKTDPNNKLKTRVGNMEGIYNHLLGWLHEWGLYAINAYLVGEMKIAHTGMDVSNRIEMTANNFSTNYRALEFNVPEQDNFFSDPSFSEGLWTFGHQDTEFFMTGSAIGELIYMNRNLYASDDAFVGLVEFNGKMMLRICNSYITQDTLYIREACEHKRYLTVSELTGMYGRTVEDEHGQTHKVYDMEQMAANYLNPTSVDEYDTMYLAIRFICRKSGSMDMGFKDLYGNWHTSRYQPNGTTEIVSGQFPGRTSLNITRDTDYVLEEVSGIWDGVGDFCLYVDGEIYVDFITFTNKPLDTFKTENQTKIEQDAYHISLIAESTVGNSSNIARLTVRADAIESFVGNYLDGDLTLATLIQQTASSITLAANNYADGKFAQLSLTVDGIAARVTTNEGDIAALELTAQGLTTRISNAEGDIADLELTAQGLTTRITNAEGDISTLEQTAQSLATRITNAEGDISSLEQTATSLTTRISNAEGDISTIEQTASSLTTRITNAEGDISTLEQTATSLSSRITSEVSGLQSQITQTADMIEMQLGYEDNNGNWVWASEITQEIEDTVDGKISTVTIGADQVNISGNINLDDAIDIENGEVSFYGDIYQGFIYNGYFVPEVEISRGYGGSSQYIDSFYSNPHIELRSILNTSGSNLRFNTTQISPGSIEFSGPISFGYNVSVGTGGIEVSSNGCYVSIENDRIIICDGTTTKTITATS